MTTLSGSTRQLVFELHHFLPARTCFGLGQVQESSSRCLCPTLLLPQLNWPMYPVL